MIRLVQDGHKRGAIVARSAKEIREVCVEGQSGILAISRLRGMEATYEPSKSRITFPNGARITTFTSEEPDQLRGPEHSFVWGDELATWSKADDVMSNLRMGLRIGTPKLILTTTPRPIPLIKRLVADPNVSVTRGSTFDNVSNLAPEFIDEIKHQYEGTRIGLQELHGEILDDVEGAFWNMEMFKRGERLDSYERIVLAVDPATTVGENSDFTAITIVGRTSDSPARFHVLHSEAGKWTPNEWAQRVNELFHEYNVDRIVAERNQGGLMVESTMRNINPDLPISTVHAKNGKKTRAEPVVALYEQSRVIHVGDTAALEEQMCLFPTPAAVNDDLVDSLVYAITNLSEINQSKQPSRVYSFPTIG